MQSEDAPILPPPQPADPAAVQQPAMQPAPNTQQPIFQNIYLTPKQNAPFAEGYAYKQALFLGWAQIIIGILCVIFQCAVIGTQFVEVYGGQGIWCGAFFILTGAFGVVSAKRRTKCLVITFMVLSILSATVFFVNVFATCVSGLEMTASGFAYHAWNEQNQTETTVVSVEAIHEHQRTAYALFSIMLILAVAEFVIAIWSAAICCGGVCCRKKAEFLGQTQYTAGAYPQVIMINQQGAQIPMQVVPQGMPGQQAYTPPPMYDAGGPPMYEQNDTLPFKA